MRKRERRVRRSPYTGAALSLQLQACAERSGVEAMILASRDGLVVASSPWNHDSTEQIAAQLSHVQTHQFRVDTVREAGAPPRTIAARGFDVGDEQMVVCAVGCPTESTVGELYLAMGGIKRILAA
jgi:hypothetical protein